LEDLEPMKRWITGAVAVAAAIAVTAVLLPDRRAAAQVSPGIAAVQIGGPSIGVSVRETTAEDARTASLAAPAGVVIESVRAGSPAERSGLLAGDIVLEIDGERVRSVQHFTRLVRETAPGRTVSTAIVRGTARQTLQLTPDAGPDVATYLRDGLRLRVRPDQLRDQFRNFNFDFNPDQFLRRGVIGRPTLGVTLTPLTTQLADYFGVKEGVLVSAVESGSPAAEAGVRAGDIITAVNGRTVTGAADVIEAMRQAEAGGTVDISVTRDRKQLMLKATIPNDRPVVRSGRRGLPV
jgi:S1-C subfamily serine protease